MRTFSFVVATTATLLASPSMTRAEERFVLTSAVANIHVDTWEKSGEGWSITKRTLHGGKQEGVDVITIDNGVMQIDVIPTRGMSIYQVRSGDLRLGWDSPVQELVHPSLIDLESRGGLGWLEGFNEFMVRCGLEFAGHPGTDEFIDNTGDVATMDLSLHGKIGNIPASEVEVIVEQPSGRIRVRGTVYEKFFYGPKLKLDAEISLAPGEDTFRIDDLVTNLGTSDQEMQIIYHTNFGAPLLGDGSRLHAAVATIQPMNDRAAEGIDGYATYAGPTPGFIEQVFLIEPIADDDQMTTAVLQNAGGDRAASMTWSTAQLPYLTVWKNLTSVEEGYVTGIEPGTGFPFNRKIERAAGRVPKLAPKQTRRFTLDIGLHVGKQNVNEAITKVRH